MKDSIRRLTLVAGLVGMVGCSNGGSASCPDVSGHYDATIVPGSTSCTTMTADVAQMGCSAALSFPDGTGGTAVTSSSPVSAAGAWSGTVMPPGAAAPLSLRATFTGNPATGGTLELLGGGVTQCSWTLSR